ncbi:hypothetical protein MG293_007323 [Ovis ammon polii]|uniref:Ig-like domain-containing protein n=1 Tax=Ovis ammon polii TaxID=230172 RepID=A0AAD4YBP7_OVIAM|nr:hypothetical protein MG293_007323 [Ovis ammon polii]
MVWPLAASHIIDRADGKGWFCEGTELRSSHDIQILWDGGDLHTLVIAEAFEDDTGRYTCLATNPSGSDSTSAEVFIEGASSTDSDSESLAFRSKPGAMPQAQKKTTSVSLTIGSSSPKSGVTTAVIQPLSVPVQQELQNICASEGQVVVLECRVRGTPPLQVCWFRQGSEIQDSPDFRILQKKEICTLVIAETFPEDAGIFTCSASNDYGSAASTAQLVVTSASTDTCGCDSAGESGSGHSPPPSPLWEASPSELVAQKPADAPPESGPESGLSSASDREATRVQPTRGVNGVANGRADGGTALPSPSALPSPVKEPPPLLAKPKLISVQSRSVVYFSLICDQKLIEKGELETGWESSLESAMLQKPLAVTKISLSANTREDGCDVTPQVRVRHWDASSDLERAGLGRS